MPDHEIAMEESLGDIVSPGDVVAGKYRVERVIGTGGMGVVVEAWHIHFEERVAIKFLFPQMGANEEALGRFEREARAAFKIKSEHVARVIDVGKLEGRAPYMVMEYLEGGDVADRLTDREPFVIEEAVDYVLQAIEAVAEAHSLGIVHRDLKPENLFIARQPDDSVCIKVLDFGLSKIDDPQGLEPRQRALTRSQQVMGTPQYMSPEQWMGAKHVGAASDQWALGIILYELLTGHQPFNQEHIAQLCTQVLRGDPPPIHALRPDVPSELVRVVDRCLEKQPESRYRNVAELAIALYPFGSAAARASARRIAGVFKRIGQDPGVVPDSNQGGLGHGMVLRAGVGEGAEGVAGPPAVDALPKPPGPPRPSSPRPAGPRPAGAASRPGRLRPERPSVPQPDEATLVQAFAEDEAGRGEGGDDAAPTAVYEHTVALPDELQAEFEATLRDDDTATGELPLPPTAPMVPGGGVPTAGAPTGDGFATRPFAPPGTPAPTPGASGAHAAANADASGRLSNLAASTLVSAADAPLPTPPPAQTERMSTGGTVAAGAPARPRRAVTAQSWQHMLDDTPRDGRKKVLAVFAAIVLSVVLALFLLVSPNGSGADGDAVVDDASPAAAGEEPFPNDDAEQEEAVEEPSSPETEGDGDDQGEPSDDESDDGAVDGEGDDEGAAPAGSASDKKKLPPPPVPRKHKGGAPSIFDHR